MFLNLQPKPSFYSHLDHFCWGDGKAELWLLLYPDPLFRTLCTRQVPQEQRNSPFYKLHSPKWISSLFVHDMPQRRSPTTNTALCVPTFHLVGKEQSLLQAAAQAHHSQSQGEKKLAPYCLGRETHQREEEASIYSFGLEGHSVPTREPLFQL